MIITIDDDMVDDVVTALENHGDDLNYYSPPDAKRRRRLRILADQIRQEHHA